jgi:hypothetical protein
MIRATCPTLVWLFIYPRLGKEWKLWGSWYAGFCTHLSLRFAWVKIFSSTLVFQTSSCSSTRMNQWDENVGLCHDYQVMTQAKPISPV